MVYVTACKADMTQEYLFAVFGLDGVASAPTGICYANARCTASVVRDVLGFSSVDAGGGWLIFAAPLSELACHPAESNGKHELYLMCDDLRAEIARLDEKGIACGPVSDQGWGLLSTVRLPGGGDLGLCEPHHPTAYRQPTR